MEVWKKSILQEFGKVNRISIKSKWSEQMRKNEQFEVLVANDQRGDYFWNFHIVNFTAIHRREEKQNFAEIIKSLNKQSTKNGREKD